VVAGLLRSGPGPMLRGAHDARLAPLVKCSS
jgi:hypothetical protein